MQGFLRYVPVDGPGAWPVYRVPRSGEPPALRLHETEGGTLRRLLAELRRLPT